MAVVATLCVSCGSDGDTTIQGGAIQLPAFPSSASSASLQAYVAADGAPFVDAAVALEGEGVSRTALTDARGIVIFRELFPGNYNITTQAANHTCAPVTIQLRAGQSANASVLCEPTAPPDANPQPPPSSTDFQVRFLVTVTNHPPGSLTSFICGVAAQDPPLSNTTFEITGTGPAPLPNQNVTGTFNANGQASFRFGIGTTGTYSLILTARRAGQTRTASTVVNAGPASATCPSVPQ